MWHWSVLWPILKWIRESRNLRILWILATSYNLSLQSSSQQLWERTLGSLLFTKHSISFVDICTWNIFLWDSKEHFFFSFFKRQPFRYLKTTAISCQKLIFSLLYHIPLVFPSTSCPLSVVVSIDTNKNLEWLGDHIISFLHIKLVTN